MSEQIVDERRKKQRVEFKTHIVLNISGTKIQVEGSSKDLSLSGVFIKTDYMIPLDAKCDVEIRLSGSIEPLMLRMKGMTVRQEPSGTAVVFESMDLDSYTHLKNIVRYNTSDPDTVS